MEDKDISKVFQEAAVKEAEAYQLFSNRYDMQFPMPERPTVKMMQAIGWQFISIAVQSVASIILAALRTADMFFAAAAGSNIWLQRTDAMVSVVAIEFGIVVFSAIKSEIENAKSEMEDLRSALKVNVKLLRTGIIACLAISIIAGLGVSAKGFGLNVDYFKWILVLVMGAGASLVAWVSGDILGAMIARFGNVRTLAQLTYDQELTTREASKRQSWEASPERAIARSELVEMKELMKAQQFRAPKANRQPASPSPNPRPDRNTDVRTTIYAYLDEIWAQDNRVPGPSELQREKGVSKSYASGVIKDWLAEHPEVAVPTSETPVEEYSDNGHTSQ